MFEDVKGKIGILTGGAGRLGTAFGQALGAAGNRVYLLDLSIAGDPIPGCHRIAVDITREEDVREVVNSVVSKEGKVDFLVNNAALQVTKPFETMTVEDFRRSLEVNLTAAYICIRAVAECMMRRKAGNIVNIGSMYGIVSADPNLYGNSGLNSPDAYAASKGGLLHLTRYLAVNLAKYNIRVNALSPGGVFNNQPLEFLEKYLPKCPMGRMLKREELIGPLTFLLSDASSFITGHNLVVDGGFTTM